MRNNCGYKLSLWVVVMTLFLVIGSALQADAFKLTVVDQAGNPVIGYRWLVEEDTTNVVTPGTFSSTSLGVNIHGTYAPVVLKGHSTAANGTANVAVKVPKGTAPRWLVSVLPDANPDGSPRYTLSGHLVENAKANVTVVVNATPVPTAQISVYLFHDNAPINNAPDPTEPGLGGFSILLFDQAGQVSQDAFGNPLGTRYDAAGNVTFLGDGEIISCTQADVDAWSANPDTALNKECLAVGEASIKYIPPGKYGVRAVGPSGETWIQTSTIEGTPGIDAWVKANEPNRLIEFGPAFWHVFIGFVQPFNDLESLLPPPPPIPGAPSTVTGNVRRVHSGKGMLTVFPGPAVEECWIGLNALERGTTVGVYAAPCNEDSTFTIPDVPVGAYQIVAWDKPLDYIFFFSSFVVDGTGAPVDLTDTLFMNAWFSNLDNFVFYDTNQNGFRDCVTPDCTAAAKFCIGSAPLLPCTTNAECTDIGPAVCAGDETPIDSMNINLRFRDGTIYQAAPTDIGGEAGFNEVFPFFKFLIAEVDFARLKATGATIVVDDGGEIPPFNPLAPWLMPSFDKLNPQPQFCTMADLADGTIRDYGSDLTAGTVDDLLCTAVGQSIIHPFTGNNLARLEQGVTLVEAFDPFADQTHRIEWGKVVYEPGENGGISGVIIYATTRAEGDPSQAAAETWEPGIPRVQVSLYADFNSDGVIDDMDGNGLIELADIDNYPFGWSTGGKKGPEDINRSGKGVFDRGDSLNVVTSDSWDDNMPTGCQGPQQFVYGQPIRDCAETIQTWGQVRPAVFDGGYAFDVYYPFGPGLFKNPDAELPLPSDMTYIVEAVPPTGYEVVKEEDKNVDFGDTYVVSPFLVPPPCVGDLHLVPAELSLFPGIPVDPAYAGQMRPLCTKKQVLLSDTQNAASDFHFFTEVPKAARGVGLINNDVALTLDPNNPVFGEKAAASWLPISIQDYNGNELSRVYTDSFGVYNFIAPSTYTVNIPTPSGVSPNMLRLCLNHPGPIPNPAKSGQFITDPYFDVRFSLTCYTFDFWPAKTTYLDTPVIPVAAYTAVFDGSLDCELPNGTPVVSDVTGPGATGPYVSVTGTKLTITSPGNVQVTNPDCQSRFDPTCAPLVTRDFGFGKVKGTVKIGDIELTNVKWSSNSISATVPAGATTGQLSITRGDNGQSSITGVTVTVGGAAPIIVTPGQSIQEVIDNPATVDGSLIIVRPGTYDGNIILYKNVKLQGSSAYSTIINAAPTLPENLQAFRQRVQALLDAGTVSLIPGENLDQHIEYAGITVIANEGVFAAAPNNARIDGFTLTSATSGGGITVNGYAHYLEISNNRVINNAGAFGGGIRVGTPGLTDPTGATDPTCGPGSPTYCSNRNDNITIHHNHILANGAVGATTGGGGIALFNGADNYRVTRNYVCGNFTTGRGAGTAHIGLSPNGLIENNQVLLNESSFNSQTGGDGGGLLIQGEPARAPATLTPGTGSVVVNANLIQGNMAGNGKGGGIFVSFPNGLDVDADPGNNAGWYGIDIFNNIIANNVAGWVGGGIFLQDAAKVRIDQNTIANNSSTSTGANAFPGAGLNQPTIPQGAGVVGAVHSTDLLSLIGNSQVYSNPELLNNIIWHNSSYSYDPTLNGGLGGLVPAQATPSYWDLQVFPSAVNQALDPNDCILSSLTGPDGADYNDGTNLAVDPLFLDDFVYTLRTAAAPGEGGNTVQVSITPIQPKGDYHLRVGSPAIDAGAATAIPQLGTDFDGEARPNGTANDTGADEFYAPVVTKLTLFSPNGGEVFSGGDTIGIYWGVNLPNSNDHYALQYSTTKKVKWITITDNLATVAGFPGLGYYDWTAPVLATSSPYMRVRVVAHKNAGHAAGASDTSDAPFTLNPPVAP